MNTPTEFAESYVALWNETDAGRRRARLAAEWSQDATYADPLMQATGHEAIGALVAGVQERFPAFRFRLEGTPDGHGNVVRFSWGLGPDGAEPVIRGTDVVRHSGGRFAAVTGFLDQVPEQL